MGYFDQTLTPKTTKPVDITGTKYGAAKSVSQGPYAGVPKGHTRLFRGEGHSISDAPGERHVQGRWFTPNYEWATAYGDRITHVDLPDHLLDATWSGRNEIDAEGLLMSGQYLETGKIVPPTDHILPPEYMKHVRPLGEETHFPTGVSPLGVTHSSLKDLPNSMHLKNYAASLNQQEALKPGPQRILPDGTVIRAREPSPVEEALRKEKTKQAVHTPPKPISSVEANTEAVSTAAAAEAKQASELSYAKKMMEEGKKLEAEGGLKIGTKVEMKGVGPEFGKFAERFKGKGGLIALGAAALVGGMEVISHHKRSRNQQRLPMPQMNPMGSGYSSARMGLPRRSSSGLY